MTGTMISDMFGTRPDLDSKSVHDRIVELERRALWISSELGDAANYSTETSKYSSRMLESLEDEKNLLELLANVMYRREKILEECK